MKSKIPTGWFFGLKLDLIINDLWEIMYFPLTTSRVNGRFPVENLCKHLVGKIFADKGYLRKALFAQLMAKGLY